MMTMMMMTVLTYNVDLHITLLGPRRKHLKGGRLPRVEVTNLQQKDGESVFCIKARFARVLHESGNNESRREKT